MPSCPPRSHFHLSVLHILHHLRDRLNKHRSECTEVTNPPPMLLPTRSVTQLDVAATSSRSRPRATRTQHRMFIFAFVSRRPRRDRYLPWLRNIVQMSYYCIARRLISVLLWLVEDLLLCETANHFISLTFTALTLTLKLPQG